MRFVQPVVMVLGVATYAACFAIFYEINASYEGSESAGLLWIPFAIIAVEILLLFVAAIITIVDSIRKVRAGKTRQLATDAMVVKLASVPFFLVSYSITTLFFLGGFLTFIVGGAALWIVGSIIGGLTFLTTLSTSIYAWAAIVQLRRDRIIGTVLTVVYAILSLVPGTDVAAGVLLFGHYRRRPRLALVMVLISAGLIVTGFGLLGFLTLGVPYDGNLIAIGPIIVLSIGIGIILVTVAVASAVSIVSIVRRSALRKAVRQSALAAGTSTESDASDRVPAG